MHNIRYEHPYIHFTATDQSIILAYPWMYYKQAEEQMPTVEINT